MIELDGDALVVTAPEVHPEARFRISFQRTLRVPDDGHDYPLPAGLGLFPLVHVDDHLDTVPPAWADHGGVMLPMHAAEALWIAFDARGYPWAVTIAAGKVNAVSGRPWTARLGHDTTGGTDQDYVVLPDQPWLDGFNSGEGHIRQFVAMPLGRGYTAEGQLTGRESIGGIQVLAYPMRRKLYELIRSRSPFGAVEPPETPYLATVQCAAAPPDMGLGPGGRIVQEIEEDEYGPWAWDLDHPSRCFIHLARAEQWPALTGRPAPTRPPTPTEYRHAGIPWFDHAAGDEVVPPSETLAGLSSVGDLARADGLGLPDDESIPVDRILPTRLEGNHRGPGAS
jgi:hypothetical protein